MSGPLRDAMTGHTKGPWKVTGSKLGPIGIDTEPQPGRTQRRIVYFRPTYRPSMEDCHLIAAAPELLKVLEALLGWSDRHAAGGGETAPDDVTGDARAAIAKARGAP